AMAHSMGSMASMASTSSAPGIDATTASNATSCLIGSRAPQATSGSADYVDPQGRKMTGHWIVPPGKQVNHSDITWFMNLQFDTRLHYAAVHLHPFARSLEMRDMTTGKTVFLAKAENPQSGVGLTHVDELSSVEGLPIQHGHKYSLISTYDNPTKTNADSMASVFLGLDDSEIAVPTSDELAHTSATLFNSKTLILHTNIGDITAALDRERAPETVIQVARFALAGAFDATRMLGQKKTVTIALPARKSGPLLLPVRAEIGVTPHAGTLSYCRAGEKFPEPTIVIDTDDAQPDVNCTGFARITGGADLVSAFQPGTSASLSRAEAVTPPSALPAASSAPGSPTRGD
ncbi:MAG: hypothetical protein ACRD3J_29575, partial [Thermoanaerobaculia bacterium]